MKFRHNRVQMEIQRQKLSRKVQQYGGEARLLSTSRQDRNGSLESQKQIRISQENRIKDEEEKINDEYVTEKDLNKSLMQTIEQRDDSESAVKIHIVRPSIDRSEN
jgi:hypothetical protein